MINSEKFGHAGFRPAICESGPAYIRRVSLLNPFIDISNKQVIEAYEPYYLESVAEANANVVFMMFSDGARPADEAEERRSFCEASTWLDEQGLTGLAGIAAGHASSKGRGADVFAKRPGGGRVPSWVPGFFMTCWTSPEWLDEVEAKVVDSLACGAQGVWFDVVMFGAAPAVIDGKVYGSAGCACARCARAFSDVSGLSVRKKEFPPRPADGADAFIKYADWRSGVVAGTIARWAAASKNINADAVVSVLLNMPAQLDGANLFGADVEKLVLHVDAIIAETNSAVRFEKDGLTYNSATSEVLQLYAADCDIADCARYPAIGIESVPPVGLFTAAMCEPVSCGAAPVLRVPVFTDEKSLKPVVFSDESLKPHRESTSAFWNWLDRNEELFADTKPHAQAALLHSRSTMTAFRPDATARFFKLYQTFTELHLPFRLVAEKCIEQLYAEGVKVLVVPEAAALPADVVADICGFVGNGGKLLIVGDAGGLPHDDTTVFLPAEIFEEKVGAQSPQGIRRKILEMRHSGTPAVYMQQRFPAPGAAAYSLREAGLYRVPEEWKKIYDALYPMLEPDADVRIEAPPYIHVREYRNAEKAFFHAVNILPGFPGMKAMALRFPAPVSARILTPDKNKIIYVQDRSIIIEVETYCVVEVKGRL